jgi:outer membrane protein
MYARQPVHPVTRGAVLMLILGASSLPLASGVGAQGFPASDQSAKRAAQIHEAYPSPRVPHEETDELGEADDSLARAIADAYESNPVLAARRYELRAVDDAVGIALAETRAKVQVQVSAGYQFTDPGRLTEITRPLADRLNTPYIRRNDLGAQIAIDQPLSTGGRATANIAAARADVLAGRQALRGNEGDLLVSLITAYSDVRTDRQTLRIRERTVALLAETLEEVMARREAGQLTRTDIAQAQTQLQSAQVQLNVARAQLEQSRAFFTAQVGREPGSLAPAPPLPLLPASIDEAFDTAEALNPDLAGAVAAEKASRTRIAVARAEKRPTLDVRGLAGVTGRLSPFHRYNEDVSWSGRATLTIPLSSGGRTSAQIAQALDRNSADRLRIEAARRQMVQDIASAWNQMVTAKRNVTVQEAQLNTAQIFYEGTFEEYREGLRSTFDVLYAQSSVRETEIALLGSRRDLYVAEANLLRHLGQLEVGKLLTGTGLYDPTAHYRASQKRSALPWDPAFRAIDRIGAPGQVQQRILGPERSPAEPELAPASASPPQELITTYPIAPLPGTTVVPERMRRP